MSSLNHSEVCRKMYKKIVSLAAVMFALLASTSAFAATATDVVKAKQAELFKVIAQAKSEAQQKQLNELFDKMIAYDVFAQNSLGDKWGERNDDERQKFTTVLTDLVRANYRRNIHKLLDFNVNYATEATDGGDVLVTTTNKHKTDAREPEIEVVFRMRNFGSDDKPNWKVVDIVTERSSMVKTFRSQFVKVLKKDGFDALIAKMKKKLDKVNKEA